MFEECFRFLSIDLGTMFKDMDITHWLSLIGYLCVVFACCVFWHRIDPVVVGRARRTLFYAALVSIGGWSLKALFVFLAFELAFWNGNSGMPVSNEEKVAFEESAILNDQRPSLSDVLSSSFVGDGVRSPEDLAFDGVIRAHLVRHRSITLLLPDLDRTKVQMCIEDMRYRTRFIYPLQMLVEVFIGRSYGLHQLIYLMALFCIVQFRTPLAADNPLRRIVKRRVQLCRTLIPQLGLLGTVMGMSLFMLRLGDPAPIKDLMGTSSISSSQAAAFCLGVNKTIVAIGVLSLIEWYAMSRDDEWTLFLWPRS